MSKMSEKDFHQDVARSSYADMLNDDERNKAYDYAIRISVKALVVSKEHNASGDKFFKCCDIGTGSGLLSMMVVRAFRQLHYEKFHIYAYEAYPPMASCAQKVIERNKMSDKITVIPTRSDESDEGRTVSGLFDLLVAELLDTELIGEGCLEAYRHAVQNLCAPTCLFVPHQARIYIEPVASSFLFDRHVMASIEYNLDDTKVVLNVPENVKNCCGLCNIDDMQASALLVGQDIHRISEPQVAFNFMFNKLETLHLRGHKELKLPIRKKADQPIVIIMWWDLIMYDKLLAQAGCSQDMLDGSQKPETNFDIISCAPNWARDENLLKRDQEMLATYGREVWREHWIQGVYYFGNTAYNNTRLTNLELGDVLSIFAYHDSHSLWFETSPQTKDTRYPPSCTCRVHKTLSRTELSFFSNKNQDMLKLLRRVAPGDSMLSDLGRDALARASKSGGPLELVGEISFDFDFEHYGDHQATKWWLGLYCDMYCVGITQDFGLGGEVPWINLMFDLIKGPRTLGIKEVQIKCMQVEFDNLNRINTNIVECEGFDLRDLDEMISNSSSKVDNKVESHYLWEYGSKRLDDDHIIFSHTDLKTNTNEYKIGSEPGICEIQLPVRNSTNNWKKGWALVFWAELKLANGNESISTGPIEQCDLGQYIKWNRYCKQLVYFLHDYPIDSSIRHIDVEVRFDTARRPIVRILGQVS